MDAEASLKRSTIVPYDDGRPGPFYYARYGHPTGVEAERALGALEGGQVLLFASGAAACTAAARSEHRDVMARASPHPGPRRRPTPTRRVPYRSAVTDHLGSSGLICRYSHPAQ